MYLFGNSIFIFKLSLFSFIEMFTYMLEIITRNAALLFLIKACLEAGIALAYKYENMKEMSTYNVTVFIF